jgi:ribokinase|tara:strand:+ start:217 stop:1137 length:921 start_codon:yes stop_codon:yes gene_type:complete
VSAVVVVGSINTDMVVRVPRLPRAGETVLGGDFRQVAGGKGANQAVAASRAGGTVAMVGCVGDDQLGCDAVAGLRREGIDVSQIHRQPAVSSGVASVLVDAGGQNSIAVAPGANACLTPAMVRQAESLLAAAEIVLVQLEVPLEAVVEATTIASGHGARVVLDPAPAQPLPDALWGQLSVITPNVTEAEDLTGRAIRDQGDALAAAGVLRDRGVSSAIVTLGAAGVLVSTRQTHTVIVGHVVEAVDTTAAGDTFAGALAARMADGADLIDASRFANAAAALAVTRIGAQPSVPTRDEVSGMLHDAR